MKKITLISTVLIATIFSAKAQDKKQDKPQHEPQHVIPASAPIDTARLYKISDSQLILLLNSALYGFDSFIKTTETPANRLDGAKKYFNNSVLQGISDQKKTAKVVDTAKVKN